MGTFHLKKGRNIKLKGAAEKKIVDLSSPKNAAIQPPDLKGFKPRVSVKVDDSVKIGTPLLTDKDNPSMCLLSPLSGKVVAINRGDKRALLEVVVESNDNPEHEMFERL